MKKEDKILSSSPCFEMWVTQFESVVWQKQQLQVDSECCGWKIVIGVANKAIKGVTFYDRIDNDRKWLQ